MLERAVFFKSTMEVNSLPESLAEVIISGRSNVGKSSIINALCLKKNLARISKTPGRTRSINVYSVSMGKWIVDLPGYGFARVSKEERKAWNKIIEKYLIQRNSRKMVYIIVDALVGPTELDFNMADWLSKFNVPFKIVANKCDKVPKNVTESVVRTKTAEYFAVADDRSKIFAVSAKKRDGFAELKTDIVKFLNS
ncbi:MAG: ribosome biogenesis GTP-binding protein YihA/YsxC [Endomicrobium sp.]|jgi:GTP-binding protein|nr:ribosome biogenesis GTP-binding protein YihA/YsxC [Endomicrobium sp.]